jgi:hypothetical protein
LSQCIKVNFSIWGVVKDLKVLGMFPSPSMMKWLCNFFEMWLSKINMNKSRKRPKGTQYVKLKVKSICINQEKNWLEQNWCQNGTWMNHNAIHIHKNTPWLESKKSHHFLPFNIFYDWWYGLHGNDENS